LKKSSFDIWLIPTLFVVIAVAVSLVVGGCTSNAVAPQNGNPDQSKLDWLNQFFNDGGASRGSGININGCPVLFDTTLRAAVSPYGYQLDMVHGKEKIGFSFPYMAVKTATTITIRVRKIQAPFGDFWMLDCGPEGQVFNYPMYAQPNQEVLNTSVAALYYYNPKTQLWEVQLKVRGSNPQLPIYHFSKYGIS
jgi:hypothetical protein